jgi:hypothetical protein
VGGLKVWNYNKDVLNCVKGVKEVRVEVDGVKQWEGEIAKATGRTDVDYATPISFKKDLKLPLAIQPVKEEPKPATFAGTVEDSQSHTESPGKDAPA